MTLQGKRIFWFIFFLLIILAAFVVPFVFFSELPKIYGAFLFWCVFAVIAMLSVEIMTRSWRNYK
ncbi:MAG: hypothetical protein Q7J85_08400 [Bacillota bacterium]|nr:hypothetical protein [Bacillota bacterium]